MATYIIGDVQGCYQNLCGLLEYIQFDPQHDRLGFVGDLVNRGPQSLATLRFIKSLKDPLVVLGNHDLHLIATYYGIKSREKYPTLTDIFNAKDADDLIEWLCQQPLIHLDTSNNYCLVHAGIPPQWSITQAKMLADEVHDILCSTHRQEFLAHMYGNTPTAWSTNLTQNDRLRYIVNACTRMRFCDSHGTLELITINQKQHPDSRFKPWFNWYQGTTDIIFGHWAALEGQCDQPHCYAIDTGCVWGNALTAIRLEDKQLFSF